MRFLRLFLVSCVLFLSGCLTTDYTLAKRSDIDQQIAAARADTEARTKALDQREISLLKQVKAEQEARLQATSNVLFNATYTFGTLKTLTRPEMVIWQAVQLAAIQLPSVTLIAQNAAIETLKVQLDEAKVSAEALQKQYDDELTKTRADTATKDKALADIAVALKHVDEERIIVLTQANDKEAKLSDARKKVDDAVIAAKIKEADDAKSTAAIKTKMSMVLGALSLICIIGTIYLPVMREKMGIASVVFGFMSIGIWYITGFVVAIVGAVCLVALVAWALHNHWIESKTASNVYNAIQEVKTTAKADYDRVLAPVLTSWQTVYDKAGNPVPDHAAIAHVDSVLINSGTK